MNLRKTNIKKLLGEERYKEVEREFHSYLAVKALLKSKREQYEKRPVDIWPYSSPLNMILGTNVQSGRQGDGPQVGVTIALESIEEELIALTVKIGQMEEALLAALDSAAKEASGNKMAKVRRALERHLLYQVPLNESAIGIGEDTLRKYKDLAIYYASKNLEYLDFLEEQRRGTIKKS